MAPTNIYVPGVPSIGKNRRRVLGGAGTSTPSLPLDFLAGDGGIWGSYFLQSSSVYIASTDTTVLVWQGYDGSTTKNFWARGYFHDTANGGANAGLTGIYFVGTNPLTNDAHGFPVVWHDLTSGYLYVAGGSHGTALQIVKSTSPNNFKAWDAQTSLNTQHTYPKYIIPTAGVNAGVHHIFSRNNNGTIYQLQLTKSTAVDGSGNPTWGAPTVVVDLGSDSRVDSGNFVLAADGKTIYGVFCRPNNSDSNRQDVFLIQYDTSDGNFYNINRSFSNAGVVPITQTTINTNYKAVNQNAIGHYGNIPSCNFDSNGNLHICYMDGASTSGPWFWNHTMWNGTAWTTPVQVGAAPTLSSPLNHRFDGMQVVSTGSGNVDLYFVTQSSTTFARGGDISKVSRSAAGSFSSPIVVGTAGSTWGLDGPSFTQRAHANARVMWSESTGDETVPSGALKTRAYGDGGLLKFNYSSTSRTLFSSLQPLTSQKAGIDGYVTTLVESGIWAKMLLHYWALNDTASGYMNWITPGSFTLTPVGSPTFLALTYFLGNGSTTKYSTGFNPSTNGGGIIGQNNMALGVGVRNLSQSDTFFDMGGTGGGNAQINSFSVTGTALRGTINTGTNSNLFSPGTSIGQNIISRVDSAGETGYHNGAAGTKSAVASTAPVNGTIMLCGNTAGFSNRQITDAFLSAGLTAAEVKVLYYARMRLRQEIGML